MPQWWLPLLACLLAGQAYAAEDIEVKMFTTTRDMANTLTQQTPSYFTSSEEEKSLSPVTAVIDVDPNTTFQTIFGIGSSLESSTCYNMMRMGADDRTTALRMLLDPSQGIGMSLMRLTVGTSDFAPLPFYSYDDIDLSQNPDEEDVEMEHFSIDADKEFILPVLKEALQYTDLSAGDDVNPDGALRFFASSWSPPNWMKSSGSLLGGTYDTDSPNTLPAYAAYLIRFLEAYAAEGIVIEGLTPQNEPLQDEDSYPTARLPAMVEAELIGKHLGPQLAASSVNSTQIWCFDHNFNTLYYPKIVLANEDATRYTAGTAFHFYGGRPSAMTELHELYPGKPIVFSEGSEFGVRGADDLVDILRNWATTYTAWVTMLDTNMQPNAGPFHPHTTMMELDLDTLTPIYKYEYYMYGQFSKFIRPGSIRVDSKTSTEPVFDSKGKLSHVAFALPTGCSFGSFAMVVVNEAQQPVDVTINWLGLHTVVSAAPLSVNTLIW